MLDPEVACAYLDGELDSDATTAVEVEVARSAQARELIEGLRAARAAVGELEAARLDDSELERLDGAVAAALDDAAVSRVVPLHNPGRPAPRRRPLPYFAIAASIAVVLSVGIALLTSRINHSGDTTAGQAVEATTTVPGERGRALDSADGAQEKSGGAPPGAAPAENPDFRVSPEAATEREGGLFLSDLSLGRDDVPALLAAAPPTSSDATAARAELASDADGLGSTYTDLRRCLESLPGAFVPTRVDTGLFESIPSYFVSGRRSGSGPPTTVVVLARETCVQLYAVG